MSAQNRIDVFPGNGTKTMLCIAGWATGPALFDSIRRDTTRVVVTPFNPLTVVSDIRLFLQENKMEIHQVMGVSMGVPLAVQCCIELGWEVPVVGIGAILGYDRLGLDTIRYLLNRSLDGYLRSFWKRSVGVAEEINWVITAFQDVGWTRDNLELGLLFMESPWQSIELGAIKSMSLIHGSEDAISAISSLRLVAVKYGMDIHELKGVGHLPFGELSGPRLQEALNDLGF